MLSSYLAIGEITKPQGVRGEVKLKPITCDIGRFEGLERAYFEENGEYVPFNMRTVRITSEAVYIAIEGVCDRNRAEALRGKMVYIDRAHAVELDEDSTFLCDLIGLTGRDDSGRELGKIVDVMQPGGNDVYVFRGPLGEVLVPALRSVVKKVDLAEGIMLLDAKRLDEVAVFDEN